MYELAGYFVTAFAVLLFLTIVVSLVIPIAFMRRKTRAVALIIVVTIWGYLYWDNFGRAKSISDWRSDGAKACYQELDSIPASFAVDSVVDHGAALSKRVLLSLLSERNLSFVEIDLQQNRPYLARADGDHEPAWIAAPASQTDRYAKIELGRRGDSHCAFLPEDLNYIIQFPPYLPDTCLSVSYSAVSTADFSIELIPPSNISSRKFGKWVLGDSRSGKVVASLTTSETPADTMTSRGELSGSGVRPESNCRLPHRVLVDRINRPIDRNSVQRKNSQVLVKDEVFADFDIGAAEAYANNRSNPTSFIKIQQNFYSKEEVDIFRKRQSGDFSEWTRAVFDAKNNGVSTYFDRILDWQERKIISIRSPVRFWDAFPDSEGFFLVQTNDWCKSANNLINRFDRSGRFLWSAWVSTPEIKDRSCSVFSPESIYVTKKHVVIERACSELTDEIKQKSGKFYVGEKWLIELPSI